MYKGQASPWGYGAIRAEYPQSLGGPFGSPHQSLPTYSSNPAYFGNPGYLGEGVVMQTKNSAKRSCSFGTRRMIPNGVTTEEGWGFRKMGKRSKRKRKSKRRRKSKRKSKRRLRRKSKRKSKRRKSRKKRTPSSRVNFIWGSY